MEDKEKKELFDLMYDIEVENTANSQAGYTDPVFELVRRRGGSVRDDDNPVTGDVGFNSKDADFLSTIVDMGGGSRLLEKVREAYE